MAREEAGMTDIDLIDWTIQEAQHLKTERREPSDLDGRPSLEKLLTVLEREPVGPTSPEDPVAQIASALSWQRHRSDDRLQMAWRHVDDEPLHLAGGNLRDLVRHRVDVPVPLGPGRSRPNTYSAKALKSVARMACSTRSGEA